MKPNEHKITVSKTARYFSLGFPSPKTKQVLFVIHGYRQLASEFINDFEIINNDENYIIAPEALNKFYASSLSQKVGATWMTKENREDEIKDYIDFLDSVYENVISQFEKDKIKITVLGFSQGTATAVRWITNGKSKAHNFIIWAGDIPPDIEKEKLKTVFNSLNLHFVLGDKDKFINEERLNQEIAKLKNAEVNFKLHRFSGGHEIQSETLLNIYETLRL